MKKKFKTKSKELKNILDRNFDFNTTKYFQIDLIFISHKIWDYNCVMGNTGTILLKNIIELKLMMDSENRKKNILKNKFIGIINDINISTKDEYDRIFKMINDAKNIKKEKIDSLKDEISGLNLCLELLNKKNKGLDK